jgi:hypothetical protein
MMRLTIVKPDGIVGVDGVFLPIDLSGLPINLRAVQWNGSTGHVEWTDQGNTDLSSIAGYQQYIDAHSNYVPPTPVEPTIEQKRAIMVCGPLQIRMALRSLGLLAGVKAAIALADEETQEAWEYAAEFKRMNPLVLSIQTLLGKTDEEVDDLFLLASTF